MKRSEINAAIRAASAAFETHGWTLPPQPRWDVTDFGLGDFQRFGLTLVNLSEQAEYCEKLMYCSRGQETPAHCHRAKKEDIICRWGRLALVVLADAPAVRLQVNNAWREITPGEELILTSGERITLERGVRHRFWADGPYAVVGEVSTANDDAHDNYFDNREVGRFSVIEEDEPALLRLVGERTQP